MSRRPWPWRVAAAEGAANARTGRWASALTIVAVAWTVAVAGAADALEVSRLVDGEQRWIEAGGFVLVATGATNDTQQTNPVPAAICDRLGTVDGISAAFAAQRSPQRTTLSSAPGGGVSLVRVTAGATAFLGVDDDAAGLALVTRSLSERTGVGDGEPLWLSTGTGLVGAGAAVRSDVLRVRVVDTAQLGELFDGVVLVPSTDVVEADTCYVRTDAAHVDAVRELMAGALGWDGRSAGVASRLSSSEFTVDYSHAYEERSLRWGWVSGGGVLALLWAVFAWTRRSRVAVYATFGMRADSRVILAAAEWGVLAVAGLAWGWGLGVVGAIALGARPSVALAQVSGQGLLVVLAASLAVVVLGALPAGSLLDHLKDR